MGAYVSLYDKIKVALSLLYKQTKTIYKIHFMRIARKAKPNINRWIFQIPINDVKTTQIDTSGRHCCILCGKSLREHIEYNMIHLLTNGNLVSTCQPFSHYEDQGFFPIGNECKNRLPNNFYFDPSII